MSLSFSNKMKTRDKSLGVSTILMIFKSVRLDELYIE